jgi:hypothetical protein
MERGGREEGGGWLQGRHLNRKNAAGPVIVMENGQRYLNPILAKRRRGANAQKHIGAEAQAQSQRAFCRLLRSRLPARVKFRYHFTLFKVRCADGGK